MMCWCLQFFASMQENAVVEIHRAKINKKFANISLNEESAIVTVPDDGEYPQSLGQAIVWP